MSNLKEKNYKYVGKNIKRADGAEKVRGAYPYLADEIYPGALIAAILFSPHANAKIISIDTSLALQLEGVHVLTYLDAPDVKYNSGEWFPGHNNHPDETVLTGHARHIGDRIALVLADTEEKARYARSLIKVEYEIFSAVVDMESAASHAALLHEDGKNEFPGKISFGDVDGAFRDAAHIETDTIITPKIHHAAMEPHCVLSIPRPGGVIEVRTPCQILFGVQHCVASVLQIPLSRIRVIKANMGGTFGGKQEVVFEALCAWAAQKLRRPVFINTDREETILGTRTRAASMGRVSTAIDANGKILGRRFDVTIDAGAYLTGSHKVMMAMGKKSSRLYRIPAICYEGRTVRTSTTPAGACRGYGSPQIHTITEIHTDLLCTRLGLDPKQFRLDNLVHEFDDDPSGASNLGKARVRECLMQGASLFGWEERKEPIRHGRFVTASGFACCTHGNGYYKTIYHDMTQMSLRIMEDGSVVLRSSIHELGNGTTTAIAQIVAEVMCMDTSRITVTEGDTDMTSYDCGCQASRVIYVCGECARLIAENAVQMLCCEASKVYDEPVKFDNGVLKACVSGKTIDIGEAVREIMTKSRVSLEVHLEYRPELNPASFGVHFAQVTVDTLTGLVKVDKYLAVHDIGQAINENFVKGQIYGGVQMGIGMALTEELVFDKNGKPVSRNFDKYHLINTPDMPEVEVLLIEDFEPGGPYGGKSIGEICTVPVAAAIINAVNRALRTSITELPATPARIIAALSKK